VTVPFRQQIKVGAYVVKQRLAGRKRYPLVLMLEPLFRCNLACAGCGKIDYPDSVLNRRLSVEDCVKSAEECGAPIVVIPGGEPLLHKEIGEIVEQLVARKFFVIVCTNALLLEKKLKLFKPNPYLSFSVHLDGLKEEHDRSVCQDGVFDRAVQALLATKAAGFRVAINATLFNNASPERVAAFLDYVAENLKVDVSISPGYAYERAPDQEHFLNRQTTKQLFRDIFKLKKKSWSFNQSTLFLDFLAGNQEYRCTPWGNPTRNIFGWQRPCYLLNEGYAPTFKALMDETAWDSYGTGNYEKCADCMMHCGYEPTAVNHTISNPLAALKTVLRGIRTEGPMAPEIPLHGQRPAEYVFDRLVREAIEASPAPARRVERSRSDHAA